MSTESLFSITHIYFLSMLLYILSIFTQYLVKTVFENNIVSPTMTPGGQFIKSLGAEVKMSRVESQAHPFLAL